MKGICKRILHRLFSSGKGDRPYQVGDRTDIPGRVDIRKEGGVVVIGADGLIHGTIVTETMDSKVVVGNNVFIGGGTSLDCVQSITIEDDVLVSHRCLISDSDNHSLAYSVRKHDLQKWRNDGLDWEKTNTAPVHICKGAWLGAQVIVLKGVTIGEGAVIGAGAVVTKDVPPWTVAAGNPAKVIRKLREDER